MTTERGRAIVERVARAICKVEGYDWRELSAHGRFVGRLQARAAGRVFLDSIAGMSPDEIASLRREIADE